MVGCIFCVLPFLLAISAAAVFIYQFVENYKDK